MARRQNKLSDIVIRDASLLAAFSGPLSYADRALQAVSKAQRKVMPGRAGRLTVEGVAEAMRSLEQSGDTKAAMYVEKYIRPDAEEEPGEAKP